MSERIYTQEEMDTGMNVSTFAGSEERGRCLQFDMPSGTSIVQLTLDEVKELSEILNNWIAETIKLRRK